MSDNSSVTQESSLQYRQGRLANPRSVFVRSQHRDARRAVIVRPADRLEPDERRGAVAIVVADVDAETDFRPVAPADSAPQEPKHIPQPPRFVLAFDARRDSDALRPDGRRQRHRVANAGLLRRGAHVDQDAVEEPPAACWRGYWYDMERGNVAVTFAPDGRVEASAVFVPPRR
jgi:hypothetical protein